MKLNEHSTFRKSAVLCYGWNTEKTKEKGKKRGSRESPKTLCDRLRFILKATGSCLWKLNSSF